MNRFTELNNDLKRQAKSPDHWELIDEAIPLGATEDLSLSAQHLRHMAGQVRLGRAQLWLTITVKDFIELRMAQGGSLITDMSVGGSHCAAAVPSIAYETVHLYFRGFDQEFLDKIAYILEYGEE